MVTPDTPTVAETAPAGTQLAPLGEGAHVGRYVITGVLGRGGMGVVYAAYDPNLDRRIALKLLHESWRSEDLVREAKALAKLDDPHVVTVFDVGEFEGHGYVAMQLVDGTDLRSALATKPATAQILRWFVAAGRGLVAAHTAGLVHRDFKPSNVLIDAHGRVAVTDFGLARSITVDLASSDVMGTLAGTPAYMAPEQYDHEHATPATDQFAFCVATWEALFGQHPFIRGATETMTPVAIGAAIHDNKLIPPQRSSVSREIVDALTRGLSRAPAARWPSMTALLAVLAPPPRRRIWPLVAVGLGAVALGGGAMFLWAVPAERGPTCEATVGERATVVWSPVAAASIAARFAHSDRSYARTAADQVSAALESYVARWRQLAIDQCMEPPSELALRRGECLETRLDGVGVVVALLSGEDGLEFVDNAQAMVDHMPDLAACSDTASLISGPGLPASDHADRVRAVRHDLTAARARGVGGDYGTAITQMTALADRAEALGWVPLVVRVRLELGLMRLAMLLPARAELLRAAELATANHLDREAARAWANAMESAALEGSPEIVAALLPIARGAIARVGDPAMKVELDILYGRALVRLGRPEEADELCHRALVAARGTLDAVALVDDAKICVVEALAPEGKYSELVPLLVEGIADREKRYGPDHPLIADFLGILAGIDSANGKLADAHAKMDRVLAIRRRAFPPRHIKIGETMNALGDLAWAENKMDEARRLYTEALAIFLEVKPAQFQSIAKEQSALGDVADATHDHAGAMAHYQAALELTRAHFPNSVVLAIHLLNYGQLAAQDNLDAGIATIGEAREILERLHDRRAAMASAALAVVLVGARRYAEAQKLLEEVVAHPDPDVTPAQRAEIEFALAQAIAGSGGDRKRARTLATQAASDYAKVGQTTAIEHIHAWLDKHP